MSLNLDKQLWSYQLDSCSYTQPKEEKVPFPLLIFYFYFEIISMHSHETGFDKYFHFYYIPPSN